MKNRGQCSGEGEGGYSSEYQESQRDLRKKLSQLEEVSFSLMEILTQLYAPEQFCSPDFIAKCRREKPEMLPWLDRYEKIPVFDPPDPKGGEKAIVKHLFSVHTNPNATLYNNAEDYYVLRKMVEISGGNPGPNKLEELGLEALEKQFKREDGPQTGEQPPLPPQPK
jgi:hypothetical protein